MFTLEEEIVLKELAQRRIRIKQIITDITKIQSDLYLTKDEAEIATLLNDLEVKKEELKLIHKEV